MVYNLFVGFFARDLNFLLYSVFAFNFAMAASCINGVLDAYLLPGLSLTPSHFLMCFSSAGLIASTIFVYRFLNIKETWPSIWPGFVISTSVGCVTFVAGLFSGNHSCQEIFGFMVDINVALTTIFLLICALVVYWRGFVLAKFMVLSWIAIFAGVMGWFGMMLGWLPQSFLTQNSLILGNLGEMLIISLGLAYKINILDSEKHIANLKARDRERYHRLVRVLSHDIANALTVASQYVMRLNRFALGVEESKFLKRLDHVIEKLRQTLDFVREEEKLKSFEESVKLVPVDLCEVVAEACSFSRRRCQARPSICARKCQVERT